MDLRQPASAAGRGLRSLWSRLPKTQAPTKTMRRIFFQSLLFGTAIGCAVSFAALSNELPTWLRDKSLYFALPGIFAAMLTVGVHDGSRAAHEAIAVIFNAIFYAALIFGAVRIRERLSHGG